ncbi:unnamed protein product [Cylindrotheca closterium]|uniref:USP domain-containing protein n=1 Tax=Cylindrotheca closterium TaxID=2856 RepID=A0AAD2G0A4_9STRA|nr:unnamed protein product [Cylindrotheca closterium]
MTAIVLPMSSNCFVAEFKPEEERRESRAPSPQPNDYVLVDNVPSTYGLLDCSSDDDDGMDKKDDSTATSSTLPSLNDIDETDYHGDFFVSKMQVGNGEESHRLAPEEEDHEDRYHFNSSRNGGLENLGNTCYLNSALQMIASLDNLVSAMRETKPQVDDSKLRNVLLDIMERLGRGETVRPSDFKEELDNRSPLFVGFRQEDSHEFLTKLLDLIDEDYKKMEAKPMDDENDSSSQTNSKSPAHQHSNRKIDSPTKKQKVGEESGLPSVPTSGSFMDLEFSDIENLLHGTNSSDNMSVPAQETTERPGPRCKLVGGRMDTAGIPLNRYDDHCLSSEPANAVKAMTDDNESTQKENLNPIQDYMTTEVRLCLTCESCKYRRSQKETFFHLSLDLAPDCTSVEEGLRKFFAPERREVKCEKCFYGSALQTTEITRLPKAILLHLKRFIVDVSPDYTSISYRKDRSCFSFEDSLDFDMDGVLHEFLAPDVSLPPGDTYAIRSVVNHIGSSASCGHYTTDAYRAVAGKREWTRFNDSFVSKISAESAIQDSSQTAYMIMYEADEAPVEKGCVLV